MENTKDEFEKDHETLCEGADRGLAAGLLIMGGLLIGSHGWEWSGVFMSLFGILIYIDVKRNSY